MQGGDRHPRNPMSRFALSDWRHSKKIKEKFGISCSSRDQVRVDADQISLFLFSTIRFFRVYNRNFYKQIPGTAI